MALREYEMNRRREAIEDLYIDGFLANSPRHGDDYLLGEYQLRRAAIEEFEDHYRELEEYIREDVRYEEMEIARREIPELEREIENLEKDIVRVREEKNLRAVQDLETILKLLAVDEPASDDAEAWAYNDGVNSVIEALREQLAAYKASL
jgi:hypothetical protein